MPANDYSLKSQSTNAQVDLRNVSSNYRNEVKTRISSEVKYAGFWIRFFASFIDGLVLGLPSFLVSLLIGLTKNTTLIIISQLLLNIVAPWLYFAIMESSIHQGTVGKKLLGMKVVDLQGNRISFLKATGRYWGKILSSIILLIGYIMAAFTEKKQALHDMIAGCLVVKR